MQLSYQAYARLSGLQCSAIMKYDWLGRCALKWRLLLQAGASSNSVAAHFSRWAHLGRQCQVCRFQRLVKHARQVSRYLGGHRWHSHQSTKATVPVGGLGPQCCQGFKDQLSLLADRVCMVRLEFQFFQSVLEVCFRQTDRSECSYHTMPMLG